jgi:hypothetical protein
MRSVPTAPMPIITALPLSIRSTQSVTVVKGMTVYRGDGRDKEKLGSTGFEAWVQLTLEEAREFVRVSVGLMEWEKSGLYGKYIKTGLLNISQGLLNKNRTPADLLEWRIRTGSGNRKVCLISTDTANTCGGYAHGYIYKMYLEGLQEREWARAVPGMKAKAPLWPSLLLNAETLEQATVIAIKSPKVMTLTEVAFLTPISTDNIVEVNYIG